MQMRYQLRYSPKCPLSVAHDQPRGEIPGSRSKITICGWCARRMSGSWLLSGAELAAKQPQSVIFWATTLGPHESEHDDDR